MQYHRSLSSVCLLLSSMLIAGSAHAFEILVEDEQGAALGNVVLLVDGVPPAMSQPPVMDQIDMRFVPEVLVVPVGTEVDFPNSDEVRHHVYSFSDPKKFELRLFKGSDAPPVLFDQPGLVVLGCNIHDQMVGYILVTGSPQFAVSNAQGKVVLNDMPAGRWLVSWWHPSLGEQPPRSLGEMDLRRSGLELALPVKAAASVEEEKKLSPLQLRFRKATSHVAH
ncbi:MAG TPA: methylamine utilization protein [Pseudomonas xinjiangensis]|uniref:Methylamine utilization protein n=2 Tax=root TaxID=1 RepID=A0A7V1FRA1_9GAMM|nr:methylamine utilization protein [Halopseudomonas xinjiangensis]HEC47540.1 methylamine utilization protein [Halopseudomonas xinjiangensis]